MEVDKVVVKYVGNSMWNIDTSKCSSMFQYFPKVRFRFENGKYIVEVDEEVICRKFEARMLCVSDVRIEKDGDGFILMT